MQPMPLIVCSSVRSSSEWYQRVLGLTGAHGGDEYEMLLAGEHGPIVLQLHEFDADEHAHLLRDGEPLGGNGVALWFETTEFATAAERVHATDTEIVLDVHVNPAAQHLEIWLRDPDGYLVVVSSPFGDVG